jgi:hypothetical protein
MAKTKTIEVRLTGVHSSLRNAITKLKESKDPNAIKLAAAMKDFNAKSNCGQTNIFRFKA